MCVFVSVAPERHKGMQLPRKFNHTHLCVQSPDVGCNAFDRTRMEKATRDVRNKAVQQKAVHVFFDQTVGIVPWCHSGWIEICPAYCRKGKWTNEHIEGYHNMYHDLADFRCLHGGNFHWKLMMIMLAPCCLNLVENKSKVGRFMEAYCAWKGPQTPLVEKLMELHKRLFVASSLRNQDRHKDISMVGGPSISECGPWTFGHWICRK